MSEITKDFIKFVGEAIVLLLIFSVVFSPEGMATSTFNYFVFAEPILLQNYIASAMTIGSQTKGEFSTNIKVTSGAPHTIKIFFQNGISYVSVIPAKGSSKTEFKPLEPTPIITSCSVKEQEIKLPEKTDQTVGVQKIIENGNCKLTLTVGIGIMTEANLTCSDGTPEGKCSAQNAPKYCENGKLVDKCSICGCLPGGYTCTADGFCELIKYNLNVYTFVDEYNSPLANVPITFDDITRTTDSNGMVNFDFYPWSHEISVEKLFGSREFSHFFDQDCDQNNVNYIFDKNDNLYSFYTFNRNRSINVSYKINTQITNLNYGSTISGKLLDENNQALLQQTRNHSICAPADAYVDMPINRNVTLEYFNGVWNTIATVDTLNDGSFSYNWVCIEGATKIRANYAPLNWFYTSTSKEISMTCPCPDKCDTTTGIEYKGGSGNLCTYSSVKTCRYGCNGAKCYDGIYCEKAQAICKVCTAGCWDCGTLIPLNPGQSGCCGAFGNTACSCVAGDQCYKEGTVPQELCSVDCVCGGCPLCSIGTSKVVTNCDDCNFPNREGGCGPQNNGCESNGYDSGCQLSNCYKTNACTYEVVCGNGIKEGTEQCDGSLEGKTCIDFGYGGGSLRCTNCMFDTSGCTPLNCIDLGGRCMVGSGGCIAYCAGRGLSGTCEAPDPRIGYWPGCSAGNCCCFCG